MALMLAFSVISISAYAEGDEGIEPYGVVTKCFNCGAAVSNPTYGSWNENGTVYTGCGKTSELHAHFKSWRVTGWQCHSCGAWTETKRVTVTDNCSIMKS